MDVNSSKEKVKLDFTDIELKSTTVENSHNQKTKNENSSTSSMNLDELSNALTLLIPMDEMEPFHIRSISPSAFSLSPIEFESLSENEFDDEDDESSSCDDSAEISIDLIDQCIAQNHCGLTANSGKLDTILEGVYLETPPKKRNLLIKR